MQLKIWIALGFAVLVNVHNVMAAPKKAKQTSKSANKYKPDLVVDSISNSFDTEKSICVPKQVYEILPDPTDVKLCA